MAKLSAHGRTTLFGVKKQYSAESGSLTLVIRRLMSDGTVLEKTKSKAYTSKWGVVHKHSLDKFPNGAQGWYDRKLASGWQRE